MATEVNSWIISISLCSGFMFSPELLQQCIYDPYVLKPKIFISAAQYGRAEVIAFANFVNSELGKFSFGTLRVMSTFMLEVYLEITFVIITYNL